MDMDDANEDNLCVSVFCGEVLDDKVNITIYNDTEIDFDEFIWNIGATTDTIEVLPLKQFNCWRNYDSLSTAYFYVEGISGKEVYKMDTIWVDSTDISLFESGKFALEIYRTDRSNKLNTLFIENFNEDCRDF